MSKPRLIADFPNKADDYAEAVEKSHDQNTDTALDQGGDNEVTAEEIREHVDSNENPHQVTAGQVGAYTKAETDQKIGDVTLTVTNLDGLKETAGAYDGQIAFIPYRTVVGDQGGGEFIWDDESEEDENHGTIFAVDGVETGRWKRILHNNTLTFDMFGAIRGDDPVNGEQNALAMRRCFAALEDNMTVQIRGTYHVGVESPSASTSRSGVTIDAYGGTIIYTHEGGIKTGHIFRFGQGNPDFERLSILGLTVINDVEEPDTEMVGFTIISIDQGRDIVVRDVYIRRCAYYGLLIRRDNGKTERIYIDNVIMRECACGDDVQVTPQFVFFAGAFDSTNQDPDIYVSEAHITNCVFDTSSWHENTQSRLPCKLHGFRDSSFTNVRFLGTRHSNFTTSEIEIDKGWNNRWENCYFQNRVECYSSSLQAELNYEFINCEFNNTIGIYTRDNDARNVLLDGCTIGRRIAHGTRTGGRVIEGIEFKNCTLKNLADASNEFILELSEMHFLNCRFDLQNDTRMYIRGKAVFENCLMDFKGGRVHMQQEYEDSAFLGCTIRNVSIEDVHDRTIFKNNIIELTDYNPSSARELLQLNGSNNCLVTGNSIRVGSTYAPIAVIRATTSNHRVLHNSIIQDAPQSSGISNPIFTQSGSVADFNYIDVNN